MKNLYSSILLLLVLLSSCSPKRKVSVNEEPTLFSRLGDREFWEERDSEDLEKKKEAKYLQDFYKNPLIDEQDIALLQSFIKPWLDFYHIDLHEARLTRTEENVPINAGEDKESLYYHPFEAADDVGDDLCNLYSPDKMRYINEYKGCEISDGKLSFNMDDSQNINLTDRRLRHHTMILFLGSLEVSHDVFWKDNDIFAIVGYSEATLSEYYIYLFDIKNSLIKRYAILDNGYTPTTYYPSNTIKKAIAKGYKYK
ncbi:hypothetical protein [Capnocytophaga gingivalis]|uniref:hypothetical protein n=1 Tax=Capnocytophaga gingivalis TaxID=1017 RepID=UPI00235237C4|nr:hypothetical protein [Capnocytophaga gingivalis]